MHLPGFSSTSKSPIVGVELTEQQIFDSINLVLPAWLFLVLLPRWAISLPRMPVPAVVSALWQGQPHAALSIKLYFFSSQLLCGKFVCAGGMPCTDCSWCSVNALL